MYKVAEVVEEREQQTVLKKKRIRKSIKAVLRQDHLEEVNVLIEKKKLITLKQELKDELKTGKKVKLSPSLKRLEFDQLSNFYVT